MTRSIRLLVLLALALSPAGAQDVAIFCDCERADGPCGNSVDTDVPGGCLNSLGVKAFLFSNGGSTSVAADDLVLVAGNLPQHQPGLIYMGPDRTELPFGDGLACVAPGALGLFRFPVRATGAEGLLVLGPGIVAGSAALFPPAGQIQPGQTWNLQAWTRDPAGPCGFGFNLTNGLAVTFGP